MDAAFLFEHVSDSIVLVDREFTVTRANPSFLKFFGIREEQVLGKKSCDVFRELSYSRCNDACTRAIERAVQGRNVAVPGDYCPHFDCVYPLFDNGGSLDKTMLVLKDAVFREESAAAATRKEEEQKQFIFKSLCHDLASPLQVIKACTDVMAMELDNGNEDKEEHLREMLEAAKRNERRLGEMLSNLRTISRLEEDSIHPEPVSPAESIGAACSDFRLLLDDTISLEWEVPSHLPKVMIEPNLLNRIFFNLLDNAARYAPSGGNIRVTAQSQDENNRVRFEVFDDGEAIPADCQSWIFEKNLTFDSQKGSLTVRRDHGWGLYFCKLSVKRFGGEISVDSRDGWGTKFAFTLPAVAFAE